MGLDDQFRPSKRDSGAVGLDGFDYPSSQHSETKRRRDCYYLPHRSCEHLDRLPAVRLFVIDQAMEPLTPNHALQRTRRERRGCNRCVPCAGSLSLGR